MIERIIQTVRNDRMPKYIYAFFFLLIVTVVITFVGFYDCLLHDACQTDLLHLYGLRDA